MTINFIGNFQNGYVGEVGDATHLVREMESLGHTVQKVPQDIWKAFVEGTPKGNDWVLPLEDADFNIICKWHHFTKLHVIKLREKTNAPVFYWVWDYMWDQGIPDWHLQMVGATDLYLGNDVRSGVYLTKNAYYFPFDVADGKLNSFPDGAPTKFWDVTFFGSWIGQGDRQEWLRKINETNPIKVYSWNPQDWPKAFENVEPAVYGDMFTRTVAESKIVLGFSVEPNCWGYWSNRVGKVLSTGSFLLQQYAPGMELFIKDGAEYFSSIEEAQEKIDHYLLAEEEREAIAKRGYEIGRENFTSKARIKQLMILAERFIKTNGKDWRL